MRGDGARRARDEEARTRLFLERVLKDERAHAQRRADEAELLAELMSDGGTRGGDEYNAYEDAGGKVTGMKESVGVAAEL